MELGGKDKDLELLLRQTALNINWTLEGSEEVRSHGGSLSFERRLRVIE